MYHAVYVSYLKLHSPMTSTHSTFELENNCKKWNCNFISKDDANYLALFRAPAMFGPPTNST